MESRREKNVAPHRDSTPVQVPSADVAPASREEFCDYLVEAREESGKSLDEIAGVTRIPIRSLERLEAGEFEKLPADVFVRGFLRSYARCVGLDIDETVRRYAACGLTPAPVASPMADELVGSLETLESSTPSYRTRRLGTQTSAEAAPAEDTPAASDSSTASDSPAASDSKTEEQASAAAPAAISSSVEKSAPTAVETAENPEGTSKAQAASQGTKTSRATRRRKRKRRKRKRRASAQRAATTQASVDQAQAVQAATAQADEGRAPSADGADGPDERDDQRDAAVDEPAGQETATRATAEDTQAVPEPQAPHKATTSRPVLVIDDARPEEAERIQEERQNREREDATWRNFLPPALLDSEEGSRRGALTLAVIILVIVATLTMSYLMRRPNDSGDGVTQGIWAPGGTAVSERGSQIEGRAAV